MINKAHSIHTLPVINWYLFSESISSGEPDFNLLFSKSENVENDEGIETYKAIVSAMPYVSLEIRTVELKINMTTNMLLILRLKGEYDLDLEQKCNNFATDYCIKLDKNIDSYEITNYCSVKNYKEVWKNTYADLDMPETFDNLMKTGFVLSNPILFSELAKKYFPDNTGIILNDIFLNKFVTKEVVEVKSIFDYIEPIQNYFIKENDFETFVFLRPSLLNLSDSQKKNKSKSHGISELYQTLFNLESFAKIKINPQTDSLFSFISFVKQANDLADKQPKPAGK